MPGRLYSSTLNNDVEWDSGELLAYLDGASETQLYQLIYNQQGYHSSVGREGGKFSWNETCASNRDGEMPKPGIYA